MERTERVFRAVVTFVARHGWPPSYAEIAEGSGLKSKAQVKDYLMRLEQRGLLALGDGPRKVKVTEEGWLHAVELVQR